MKLITDEELANLIKAPDQVSSKDYVVIDVRDTDFVGGNIRGAVNEPLTTLEGENIENLSKVPSGRGPTAAAKYEEARKALYPDEPESSASQIAVLQGGFMQFQSRYKDDSDLVEDWDAEKWGTDKDDQGGQHP
ncbi:hypothetical protein EST38_g7521 [Candolleomyces aberdarensis]|uniref:Rhodanese domain-containing protein n=1 Tax=Candolleomyces aberdarensis TaxID=2316362 RepID=A0A4Q2DH49_9AGAR|nr:hypothetical protein EST38_g7521 [Candolleomyces aberdarensis]